VQITSGWLSMPSDLMFPRVHPGEWMLETVATHWCCAGGTLFSTVVSRLGACGCGSDLVSHWRLSLPVVSGWVQWGCSSGTEVSCARCLAVGETA
jgi:hypothetical protein